MNAHKTMKPFGYGTDIRGDKALFLPADARLDNPNLIAALKSIVAKRKGKYYEIGANGVVVRQVTKSDPVFFRAIDSNGVQLHSHGWIRYNLKTKTAEITQYG